MKNASRTPIGVFMLILLGSSLFLLAGCGQNQDEAKMKAIAEGQITLEKNLTTFDTLDYIVFSNQEWVRLHESHSQTSRSTGPMDIYHRN
jgi:hypothetical protein